MLPGLKAALNYHPMFVHFPIVLWLAALLFEIFAVWRCERRSAAHGFPHALSRHPRGNRYRDYRPRSAKFSRHPAMRSAPSGIHETLMLTATSLAIALCSFAFFMRKNFRRSCARSCCWAWWCSECSSLSAPTAARSSSTIRLGGELVHRAAAELSKGVAENEKTTRSKTHERRSREGKNRKDLAGVVQNPGQSRRQENAPPGHLRLPERRSTKSAHGGRR